MSNYKKRVLFVSDVNLSKSNHAGNVNAINSLIDYLSQINTIQLAYVNLNKKISTLSVKRYGGFGFFHSAIIKFNKFLGRNELYNYKKSFITKFYFYCICLKYKPDIVVIEYLELAFLKNKLNGITWVCDLHDLMSLRRASYEAKGKAILPEINIDIDKEMQVISTFDKVLSIQKSEHLLISKATSNLSILTARNNIAHSVIKNKNLNGKPIIGFIGGSADFNIDSVRFIIEIFSKNKFDILIAGAVCDYFSEENVDSENIKFLGRVDDVKDFYKEINILLNPIEYGSGLKTKNVEAISFGVPVLTTSVGMQGLEHLSSIALFEFKTESELLDMISRIEINYDVIIENCRSAYIDNFSDKSCYLDFEKYIASCKFSNEQ